MINLKLIIKLMGIYFFLYLNISFALPGDEKPYTYQFVDRFVSAFDNQEDNNLQLNVSDKLCNCKKISKNATTKNISEKNSSYDRMLQGQFLKYAGAVAAYNIYKSAADDKKQLLNYIIGITGYWEIKAAQLEKKLLRPMCGVGGAVDRWRKGYPVEGNYNAAIDNFAALTSTLGDLFLGLVGVNAARVPVKGVALSYKWGQLQEAALEREVFENCSGGFIPSSINPDNLLTYKGFKLHLLPQFVWINFTTDFLTFDPQSHKASLAIENGKKYLVEYENNIHQRTVALMELAYSMINSPNEKQKIIYRHLSEKQQQESFIMRIINKSTILRNLFSRFFNKHADMHQLASSLHAEYDRFKHGVSVDLLNLSERFKPISANNKIISAAITANNDVINDLNSENPSLSAKTNASICKLLKVSKISAISCSYDE